MWDLAVREEEYAKADSLLRRKFAPEKLPAFHRAMLALTRADSAGFRGILQQVRAQGSGHPYGPGDIALYLNDFAAAREFAGAIFESPRAVAVRDSVHHTLGLIALAEGRWGAAKQEFQQAERVMPSVRRTLALSASFPFLSVPSSDLVALRSELEQWNPAGDPPEPNPGLAARLRNQERLYLLGLLSSREGQTARALQYARELAQMEQLSEVEDLVGDLATTIKADVSLRRDRPEETLGLLQLVRGHIPPELLASSSFSEEAARYLKAEALYRLGRNQEALRWYSFAFEGTPNELVYLAPSHFRRGELYERLGDRKQAVEHYSRFIKLWSGCDPGLRPRVEEARNRLASLLAEPR